MTISDIIKTVHATEELLNSKGVPVKVSPSFDEQFRSFIKSINPNFPTDTVDVIDMINVALNGDSLPDSNSIDILKALLHDADFYHGDLRWKYKHPVLIAQFSPKNAGSFYEIIFKPTVSKIPLGLPLTVTLNVYADMDDLDNHPDECQQKIDGDDNDGSCECETYIIHSVDNTFETRKGFLGNFSRWLLEYRYPEEEKEYDVFVHEVHTQTVRIKAKSIKSAIDKVEEGEGTQLENSLEYCYTLDKDLWRVEEV